MIQVRTRFAPSPTGYLHVGSLRTALYAYLFARKHEGVFVLRIEDTDQKRYVEGSVENLTQILDFFGLHWDEGPYFQSQRSELYREKVQILLDNGAAYHCFCSAERLEEMRQEQEKRKQSVKYDRTCLRLSPEEVQNLMAQGVPHVIRQKIPHDVLVFHDLIRGKVRFDGRDVDDQVLIKSDGYPTYHLANVVDDHEMGITHVIRGEEWLPSTPKHIWLYQGFAWTPPEFAHLPLLLNPDKSKLSKRQGDVAAEDFIKKGYLKEAMLNFIAFLGWNPGTEQEIFSIEELIQAFSLDRVNKSGAVFNVEKLDWLNGVYLREMDPKNLAVMILEQIKTLDWFKETRFIDLNSERLQEAVHPLAEEFLKYVVCVQTRMKTLIDGPEMLRCFLLEDLNYELKLFENPKMKADLKSAALALEEGIKALENLHDFTHEEAIKHVLTELIARLEMGNGQVLWPMRVALTNEAFSPGVFELMQIMGREMSLKRLRSALAAIK